jgi:putative SOS response-associated peptidase YedK
MCSRYTNTTGVEELNARLRVPVPSTEGTRPYNIAPTEQVLAIVARHGEPEARRLRWGLVPPWASDLKGGAKLIKRARGDDGAEVAGPRADPEGVAAGAAGC